MPLEYASANGKCIHKIKYLHTNCTIYMSRATKFIFRKQCAHRALLSKNILSHPTRIGGRGGVMVAHLNLQTNILLFFL